MADHAEEKQQPYAGSQPQPPTVASESVEAAAAAAADASAELDPNEVDWDGLQDPENPRNWSVLKRGWMFGVIMALDFSTSLTSSTIAPAVPALLSEFGAPPDDIAGTLIVTIEIMGTAVGPLLLAPLSETQGRQVVYNLANLAYCAFTVGCALAPSLRALVALRFLQGCAASAATNNVGGTIGDIVPTHRRGAAISFFTISTLFGPVVGPIAGSYLAAAAGWQWVFWLLLIMVGSLGIICAATCRETYEPVLLQRKAKALRKQSGNPHLHAKGWKSDDAFALFRRAVVRPMKMLFLCPLITGLSLYISVAYGFTYLLFSTFSNVFQEQYQYSDANLGLAYLGLAGGMLVGLSVTGVLLDRTYLYLTKKNGVAKPE